MAMRFPLGCNHLNVVLQFHLQLQEFTKKVFFGVAVTRTETKAGYTCDSFHFAILDAVYKLLQYYMRTKSGKLNKSILKYNSSTALDSKGLI